MFTIYCVYKVAKVPAAASGKSVAAAATAAAMAAGYWQELWPLLVGSAVLCGRWPAVRVLLLGRLGQQHQQQRGGVQLLAAHRDGCHRRRYVGACQLLTTSATPS